MRRTGCALTLMLLAVGAARADSPVLPPLSREWRGADYRAVADLIDSRALALPRLGDPAGAKLIARLTATGNLSLERDRARPILERLQDFNAVFGAANRIGARYAVLQATDASARAETVLLMGFVLRSAGVGASLVSEYLPVIPHDDRYETRMRGVDEIASGVTTMMDGAAISIFEERSLYSGAQLTEFIDAMAGAMPSVRPFLKPDSVQELLRRLKSAQPYYVAEPNRHKLEAMIRALAP